MTLRRSIPFWTKKVGGGACSNPPITGILDTYPGAAIGFSFRRLRNSYSGNCVRVGSDNTSNFYEVGFCDNYVHQQTIIDSQIDYPAGSGFTKSQKWYDQSLNGNNLTLQGSSNVVLARNLDGSPVTLASTDVGLSYNTSGIMLLNADVQLVSVFIVFRVRGFGTADYVLYKSSGGNNGLLLGGGFAGLTGLGIVQAGAIRIQGNTEDFLRHLGVYLGGTATNKIRMDAVDQATNTTSYTDPFISQLGSTLSGTGIVQELLVYESAKDSDLAGIEANINSYYGIY